jgi:hypothetical protein
MPTNITEIVLTLPRETVLEAATFVAEELAPDEEPESEATWVGSQPFTHVGDVEALARLLLIGRALDGPDGLAAVETAIEGSGKKNLVLGGMEIIALAGLGVIGLRMLVTRGRLTEETVQIQQDRKNRRWSAVVKEIEKPISISDELAAVLRPLFSGMKGSGT